MRLWLQIFSLFLYLTTSKSSISTFTDQLLSIFQPKISVSDAQPQLEQREKDSLRGGKNQEEKREWGVKEIAEKKKWKDKDENEKARQLLIGKLLGGKGLEDKRDYSKDDEENHLEGKDDNDEKPKGENEGSWAELDTDRERDVKNVDREKLWGKIDNKEDEKQRLNSKSLEEAKQQESKPIEDDKPTLSNALDNLKKWGSKFLDSAKLWGNRRVIPLFDRRNRGNMNFRSGDAQIEQQPLGLKMDRNSFHIDPVLNMVRRRSQKDGGDAVSTESSDRELPNWKDEFQQLWMHKKFEALNQTAPGGDNVNMIAARPWGVPCGDPNQHDMPWGSCMLPMECDPEFRVYRGDMFCGRTRFVCCAILLTTYDMYQGFDVSFDGNSMTTDSEERREREKTSKEKRKITKERESRKRHKIRSRRKKKMQKDIKKIIKEIRKILKRQYSNGTHMRKKKTKQLKKFIKTLKKQYRKDRQKVRQLQEQELLLIDNALQDKLKKMKFMNEDFINNATFREIVVNGTISKKGARMLLDTYPELVSYLETRREVRRRMLPRPPENSLSGEYDLEYGYLYS